jgi:hypothetical protein
MPLDPPLSALEDSALRRNQLMHLALAMPTSKDPEYDRKYYYALRAAHSLHLTESDFAELRETEQLVAKRIEFIQEPKEREAELERHAYERKRAADAQQERHLEFNTRRMLERQAEEDDESETSFGEAHCVNQPSDSTAER